MNKLIPLLLAAGVSTAAVWASSPPELPPPLDRPIDYRVDIAPLLSKHCIRCHGPKKQKSLYRMDSRDDAIGSGSEHSAIIPGNSAESLVVVLVAGTDPDYMRMPPKGDRLTAEEVSTLRAWIDQGLPWDEGAPTVAVPVPGLSDEWRMASSTPDTAFPQWIVTTAPGSEGELWAEHDRQRARGGAEGVLLWNQEAAFQSGKIATRFQPIQAGHAAGGGLVWAVKDSENFLLALYDSRQHYLGLFQVEDGVRRELAHAEKPLPAGDWYDLEVTCADSHVTVRVNSDLELSADIALEEGGGGAGLWKPVGQATRFTLPEITW